MIHGSSIGNGWGKHVWKKVKNGQNVIINNLEMIQDSPMRYMNRVTNMLMIGLRRRKRKHGHGNEC